jgi:hypothetical protein
MSLDEPSCDRQTKSGTSVSWGSRCVDPEESLKDTLMIFRSNFWQDDTALEKLFSITERYKVIFRAEASNVFNRAQYGQPSGSFNTASFGHITSVINTTGLVGTGTPRQMEFALRPNF